MLFRRRARRGSLSRFGIIAAIAITPVIALTGLWLYLANLDPEVTVPTPVMPAPNAYDDYVAATELLVRTEDLSIAVSYPRTGDKVLSMAEKADMVRANQPALTRLRQGLAHRYHEPPARSFAQPLPHFVKFRDLARALSLEGQVKAARGDHGGAMDSYLDAVHFGQEIARGGPLIGRLVAVAVQAVGRKPAWNAVSHLDGASARRAARRMEAIHAREVPFADTMREEMWLGQAGMMELFRKNDLTAFVRLTDENGGAESRAFNAMVRIYGKRRAMNHYTRYMEAIQAQVRQPYSADLPDIAVPQDPINRMLVPVISRTRFRDVSGLQVQNALLTAALAIRAYRAEHGTYPDSLSQLVPDYLKAVPADPFAPGAPLRYRRTTDGKYVLYSVGPDGKDDHGKAIDDPSKGSTPQVRHRVDENSRGDMVAGVNIFG